MATKTYYEILDVEPTATAKEIAIARRRLTNMNHPDKVAHLAPEFRELAEKRTKEINAAYDVLRDPQKRAKYDRELADQRRAEENHQQAEEEQRRREAEAQAAEERRRREEESRRRDNQQQSEEQRRREKERRQQENQQRAEEARRRREAEARAAEERRRREEESWQRENRHSRMGIASFVLSLLSSVVLVLLSILVVTSWQGGRRLGVEEIILRAASYYVPFGPVIILYTFGLALGLGVAGIIQWRRKKLFAILGAILSVLPLASWLLTSEYGSEFGVGVIILTTFGLALGLGMTGIIQLRRKKLFVIIGAILSALPLVSLLLLLAIALLAD